jgi:FtsP/CotA-like multicopper oxidase with cupredoxin domain
MVRKSFLSASLAQSALAGLCKHEWVVEDRVTNYFDPNAAMQRGEPVPPELATAGQYVNSLFPGPTLECDEDDDVEVKVINKLKLEGTMIHWHGLYMNSKNNDSPTPWADGVNRFSHAPIMPGENYTYKFKAWPPGTHWWHSHMDMMQVDRGVKGAIVVRKKQDNYASEYDVDDLTVFITDARKVPDVDLMLEGQAMDSGNPVENEINKVLWNGVYGNGTKEFPYPQIEVEQGKCYRMRWINAGGNLQNLQIKVAGHRQTIIALDGEDVEKLPVTGFNLHAGERADAIFCADQEPGNYLINATYDLACDLAHGAVGFGHDKPPDDEQVPFIPLPPVDSCMFYAFIKYKGHDEIPHNKDHNRTVHGGSPVGTGGGSPEKGLCAESLDENCDQPGTVPGFIHFDINTQDRGYQAVRNVDVIAEPAVADFNVTLYGGIIGDDFKVLPGGHNSRQGRGQFGMPVQAGWMQRPNTHPFTSGGRTYLSTREKAEDFWSMSPHWPSTPALHTQGKCGTNGANIIDVPETADVVELTLVNLSPSAHVFHLHGMHFQVINYGFPEWCNYKNHWVCFFMPRQVSGIVAKQSIGGTSIAADPKHKNMGGPFYWGIEPDKNHPNYKKTLNLESPLRKDMISLWRHQWAVIRIRPKNPGMWLLHCHMEQHVPSGMMVALNVKPSLQPPIPADVPTSGSCPVHGWAHTQPKQSVEVKDQLEIWQWVVDYQRPTRDGPTWNSKRLSPNQLEPEVRSSFVLAGDVFPGKTLKVTEGDQVVVNMANNAYGNGVAVHFHGQSMQGTPWMDGTFGVTQSFIMPENNFTYSFTASTPGTHMYYQAGLMGARGLKGTLVVQPKADSRLAETTDDMLMQISDNWQQPAVCLTYDGVRSKPLCPPVQKVTFDGMWGDGGKLYPYAEYEVKHGVCYRLRMVGLMSQVQRLNVSIESHVLTLLAVDGTEVVPQDVSSVVLHAGERYDFKLCADQGRSGEFAIVAEAPELCSPGFLQRTGHPAPETCRFEARLKYTGLFSSTPTSHSKQMAAALDLSTPQGFQMIKPLEAPPVLKSEADQTVALRLGVDASTGQTFLHTSAHPWVQPSTPLLMTAGKDCATGVPMVHVDEDATDLEVSIHNELSDLEVVHVHGLRFQVTSMSTATNSSHDLTDAPLLRDTVAIPSGATVTLRLAVDNPGIWMLHAMSVNTFERGAATVFNVLPSQQVPVPSDVPMDGPCASQEISV